MDQEKLQLTGANTIRKDRNATDFYPTPPKGTIALMEFMKQNCEIFKDSGRCTIWEPACGDLAISNVLNTYGHSVLSTDILTGTDFLTCQPPAAKIDAIITNPPFSLAEEFITRSLLMAPVVAMLLKSQYWHASRRVNLYNLNPPSFILPLTWRLDFLNGAKGGRPTMEVAWTVWIRGKYDQKYVPLAKPR